jgi:hypothetical protein
MKTKMGRPKMGKGEAKGVHIGARFTPDEAKKVEYAAKRARQVKSEWVRSTLLGVAESIQPV